MSNHFFSYRMAYMYLRVLPTPVHTHGLLPTPVHTHTIRNLLGSEPDRIKPGAQRPTEADKRSDSAQGATTKVIVVHGISIHAPRREGHSTLMNKRTLLLCETM